MNKYLQIFFLICNICLLASFAYGVTEELFPSTTTIVNDIGVNNITCENHNNDCKACVAYSECFYCGTDNICRRKITDAITGDECTLKEIHYLTCRVNTSITEEPFSSTTTAVNNITCENHNNDCKACVAYSECFYCGTDNICRRKITDAITGDECSLKEIHYLTCRVNFQYMLIGIGILILVAFLIITIFCCICCCRRKGLKISKADLKWARQREERKQIQMERRQERAERTEEIRKKYGLVKGSNPYQKFDA